MNLYQIHTPRGGDHAAFQYALLEAGGGFSAHERRGCWRGPDGIEAEAMTVYEVGCEPGAFETVARRAADIWPDEKAWFMAQLGAARVISGDDLRGSPAYLESPRARISATVTAQAEIDAKGGPAIRAAISAAATRAAMPDAFREAYRDGRGFSYTADHTTHLGDDALLAALGDFDAQGVQGEDAALAAREREDVAALIGDA
jgi:hypothetical protein